MTSARVKKHVICDKVWFLSARKSQADPAQGSKKGDEWVEGKKKMGGGGEAYIRVHLSIPDLIALSNLHFFCGHEQLS
jgi:hypothetical protein